MGKITVERCYTAEGVEISGLRVITPTVIRDDRGYFAETYHCREMAQEGLDMTFVQDNQSLSVKGVLRGLHFQKQYPQGKLVRVAQGKIFDVAVDLRRASATFGKWYGLELSADNFKQFYIPEGFAHGFLVLSGTAISCYKMTDFYHPGDDGGIAWNDPEIGIPWPQLVGTYNGTPKPEGYSLTDGTKLCMSQKDMQWQGLKAYLCTIGESKNG